MQQVRRVAAAVALMGSLAAVIQARSGALTSPALVDVTPTGVVHPDLLASSGTKLFVTDDGPMYDATKRSGSTIVSVDTTTGTSTTVLPTGWFLANPAGDGLIDGIAATSTGGLFTDGACGGGELFGFGSGSGSLIQGDFPPVPPNGGCQAEYQRLAVTPDQSTIYAMGGMNFGGVTGTGGYDVWTKSSAAAGQTWGIPTDPTSPTGYPADRASVDGIPPTGSGATIDEKLVGKRLYIAYTSGLAVQTLDGSNCAPSGAVPSTFCALTAFGTDTSSSPSDGALLATTGLGGGNDVALHMALDGAGDIFVLTYSGKVLEAATDGKWHVVAGGGLPATAGQSASSSNFNFNPGGIAVIGPDVYVSGYDASYSPHVWKITGVATAVSAATEASDSTVVASPTSVAAGGSQSSIITVTLLNGTVGVAGEAVSLTPNSGSNPVIVDHGPSNVTGPDGRVEFLTTDATPEVVTYTAKDLTTGATITHTATVTFTSPGLTPTVALKATTTTAAVGDTVTYTATVTGTAGTPTGAVTFVDQGSAIAGCTSLALAAGAATCPIQYTSTAGSPHEISVRYIGNTTYAPAASPPPATEVVVSRARPDVNLVPDENPASVGDTVTYALSITGKGVMPQGKAAFYDGSTVISTTCADVQLQNGAARCKVQYTSTASSPHQITATYTGDDNYLSAGSNLVQESVQGAGAQYVALGDSYSAGVGSGPYLPHTDILGNQCYRSTGAYGPELDNEASLGSMAFVACSGAVTDDLYTENKRPDGTVEPAQLCGATAAAPCPADVQPRLGPTTRVVTLTIGGNDIGFSDVLKHCIKASVLKVLHFNDPKCMKDPVLADPVNARIKAFAGSATATTPDNRPIHPLAAVLADIHQVAPNATIYISDYPALFGKVKGDCTVGTLYGDDRKLFGHDVQLDAVIGEQQASQLNTVGGDMDKVIIGVVKTMNQPWLQVVRADQTFKGHGFCDTYTHDDINSPQLWFNPLAANVNTQSQDTLFVQPASFHPDAAGQRDGFESAFLSVMP